MDTTSELTLIISSLSFIATVLGLLYLKGEVDILKHESEKRKVFANTSNAIIQVIDKVEKTTKAGILSPLDISSLIFYAICTTIQIS